MWLNRENPEDPYNRLRGNTSQPNVGAGGGAGQPEGTVESGGKLNSPTTVEPQEFAPVQDYLRANQQQGEELGKQFIGKLNNTANQLQGAIGEAANEAESDISKNKVEFDPGLVQKAKSNPVEVANDGSMLQKFLSQWNAEYKGPSSFESSASYTKAADAATKGKEKQEQIKTAGGQQQLFQDEFGVYGQGNKGLDQALLQTSSYFPEVQAQSSNFGNLQDYLAGQSTRVGQDASQAKTVTDATREATRKPFETALTDFQAGLQSKLSSAQEKINSSAATAASYRDALASGDPVKIEGVLRSVGVSDKDAANIVDYIITAQKDFSGSPQLGTFVNYNPSVADISTVASPEDYATARALEKLTGVDYGGILNPADAEKAGAFSVADPNSAVDTQGISQTLRDYLLQQEGMKAAKTPVAPGGSTDGTQTVDAGDVIGNAPAIGNIAQDAINNSSELDTTTGNLLTGGLGSVIGGKNGIVNQINSGVSGIVSTVDNAFGGGKRRDPVVGLPRINLPRDIKAPSSGNAATTKAVSDIFNTPLSLSGSYHEGSVQDMTERIGKLADLYRGKQITAQEYKDYAGPLIGWATTALKALSEGGNAPANAAKTIQPLLNQYLPVRTSAVSSRPGVPAVTYKDPITGLETTAY